MANSYIVVAEPYGKSLGLCCEECGVMKFGISWWKEGSKEWDKIVATCEECGHHNPLAVPFDPFAQANAQAMLES